MKLDAPHIAALIMGVLAVTSLSLLTFGITL
jgi:hypothetical protein